MVSDEWEEFCDRLARVTLVVSSLAAIAVGLLVSAFTSRWQLYVAAGIATFLATVWLLISSGVRSYTAKERAQEEERA